MAADLLPCPFCGIAPTLTGATEYFICCENRDCIHPGTGWWRTRDDAIAAWNRRAPIAAAPVVTDAMVDAAVREAKLNFMRSWWDLNDRGEPSRQVFAFDEAYLADALRAALAAAQGTT